MLKPRFIPVLQILNGQLVKTERFKKPRYIGDPLNAVRIFNEKEVDELIILDISPERYQRGPDFELIDTLLSECQMPVGYGGGVRHLDDARHIFHTGVEKVIINTLFFQSPDQVKQISQNYGEQALSLSLDFKKNWLGHIKFYTHSGSQKRRISLENILLQSQEIGCGEIILHDIDRDGTFEGFSYNLLKELDGKTNLPIVVLGGARHKNDLEESVLQGAHSAAAGSMFVFQGPHKAVLIQY